MDFNESFVYKNYPHLHSYTLELCKQNNQAITQRLREMETYI